MTVGLLLVGIALGCGASAVAPVAKSWAQPQGHWSCYVVDRFPDVQEAADWDGAANITKGLNKVATQVAPGTILALAPESSSQGSYPSVACVKY
jgi:hypothetical protein